MARSVPVYLVTQSQLETLRQLAEQADNALTMRPIPRTLGAHIQHLTDTLVEVRKTLLILVQEVVGSPSS